MIVSFESFSHQREPIVSPWSLSNSKSLQISRTLLGNLADLNNTFWVVSTHPLISTSSSHSINTLLTISRAKVTIGITVTFIFYSFFNFLTRSRYLSFFSLSLWSVGTEKLTIQQVLFFYCWHLLGLIVWPRLGDPFVSPEEFMPLIFFRTDSRLCIDHLFVWSNFNLFLFHKYVKRTIILIQI